MAYGKSADLDMHKIRARYGHTIPPAYFEDIVKYVLIELSELIEELGLKSPRIVYSKNQDCWAAYLPGTYDWPVIAIDVEKHENEDMIEESITNSLVHELVHATLEKLDVLCILYKHDEDFVQELADHYCRHCSPDVIKKRIEEKVKEIRKMEDFYVQMKESDKDTFIDLARKWCF